MRSGADVKPRSILTITVYQDKAGGWRWRLKASNGRTVADSGEAYASQANANRAANRLVGATIVKG